MNPGPGFRIRPEFERPDPAVVAALELVAVVPVAVVPVEAVPVAADAALAEQHGAG